jgi:hypothetical protein
MMADAGDAGADRSQGADAASDTSREAEASFDTGGSIEGGGCACRAGSRSSRPFSGAALLALLSALTVARRVRSRRASRR